MTRFIVHSYAVVCPNKEIQTGYSQGKGAEGPRAPHIR